MSEVHIIAVFSVKPEKMERVKELMVPMIKGTCEEEDYTLRYIMTEQLGTDTPDIVMIETYKDRASADKHTSTDRFKALFGTFEKEDIMAKAPYVAHTKSLMGFDLDRKLI